MAIFRAFYHSKDTCARCGNYKKIENHWNIKKLSYGLCYKCARELRSLNNSWIKYA